MKKYIYINANELRDLTSPKMSLTKAREVIQDVNKKIEASKHYVPCNYRAPKEMVLEYLGLKGE